MSEHNGGGGDEWAFSEGKDWKDGRHERDNHHVHAHAAEVPQKRTRRALSVARAAFERAHRNGWLGDDWPATFEETQFYRDIMGYHATEGFSEAVEDGDSSAVRHYVGSQEDEPDLSGMRTIQTIEDLITGDASMLYIFGHMGNGKSMAASLFAEIWDRNTEGGKIATNSRTVDAAKWISTWPSLNEWMVEDEETVLAGNATPKLFILDEASSNVSGRGSDGYDASTKLAVLVYKIRKFGGSLIIIGHDGKDVHPAVRELCTAFHKTDTKTGQFYREVHNRKGRDPITRPLDGIPLPDKRYQPNTYDTAPWSWSSQSGEDDDIEADDAMEMMTTWTIVQCKEDGLSDRETAKFVPFSKSKVNRVWNDVKDTRERAEIADTVTEVFD